MPELVLPSVRYRESYLEAMAEFRADDPVSDEYGVTAEGFDAHLARLADDARGRNLVGPRVPSTEWWLVEGGRWIGDVSIRHWLNEKLEHMGGHIGYAIRPTERGKGYGNLVMELGMVKARELGIARALLTCDDGNAPSIHIIERHGGVLQDTVMREKESGLTRRYWVDLGK
jgi:predicted acetyltransferase